MTATQQASRKLTDLDTSLSYVVIRSGLQALVWLGDRNGEYRPTLDCTVKLTYRGTRTGGSGTANVEHGDATVTMPDGRVYAGEYTHNGDGRFGETVFGLAAV